MVNVTTKNLRATTARRIVWMDLLRGIAIVLVVLDHSSDQIRSNTPGAIGAVNIFNDAVSPFRMAALMFLSGMLLARSLAKPWRVYVVGKLGKVGWPYLLWSFAILGLLAATSFITGGTVTVSQFVRVFYDPPTYLWYLAYLLLFYAVSLILRSGALRSALVPVALVASAFMPYELKRLLFLFAFFLLGDLVSRHSQAFDRVVARPAVCLLGALLGMATALAAGSGISVRYESLWSVGVMGMIVAVIPLLKRVAVTAPGRFLASVGQNSIVYYVTHWCVILVSYHVLYRAGVSSPLVLFVSVLACGLASGYLMVAARKRFRMVGGLYELPLNRTKIVRARELAGAERMPA